MSELGRPRAVSGILVALPAGAVLVLFLVAMVELLLKSAYDGKTVDFQQYVLLATDPYYLNAIGLTFKLSLITTVIAVLWGLPIAYWMVRSPSRTVQASLVITVAIPFLVTHIVKLYALLLMLGNTGVINEVLRQMGVIAKDDFIPLIRNQFAVVVGLLTFAFPFTTFVMATSIKRFDRVVEEAARNLGATTTQTFLRITLPLITPGLTGAATLTFVLSSTALSTPLVMGGGAVRMMANLIYDQAMTVLNLPLSATLAVVALVTTVTILIATSHIEAIYFGRRRAAWVR